MGSYGRGNYICLRIICTCVRTLDLSINPLRLRCDWSRATAGVRGREGEQAFCFSVNVRACEMDERVREDERESLARQTSSSLAWLAVHACTDAECCVRGFWYGVYVCVIGWCCCGSGSAVCRIACLPLVVCCLSNSCCDRWQRLDKDNDCEVEAVLEAKGTPGERYYYCDIDGKASQ